MSSSLLIPIHLDTLHLKSDLTVLKGHADFSSLPWFDGQRDINGGTPYISEEILSSSFEDKSFTLKKGIHLHWALPDTLALGVRGLALLSYYEIYILFSFCSHYVLC